LGGGGKGFFDADSEKKASVKNLPFPQNPRASVARQKSIRGGKLPNSVKGKGIYRKFQREKKPWGSGENYPALDFPVKAEGLERFIA